MDELTETMLAWSRAIAELKRLNDQNPNEEVTAFLESMRDGLLVPVPSPIDLTEEGLQAAIDRVERLARELGE